MLDGAGDAAAQVIDFLRQDAETGRHRMAAKTEQLAGIFRQGCRNVDAFHRAGRCATGLTRRGGDQGNRTGIKFREAAGYDSNHPGRPGRVIEEQEGRIEQGWIALNLGLSRPEDIIT